MEKYWRDFPTDLVAKIAEHIEFYEDYENIGQICSDWRLAMKDHKYMNKTQTQLPWLMLTDPDDYPYRRYYSLTKCMFRKFDLPQSVLEFDKDNQIRRFFSSHGWLISVTQKNMKVTLFDPFSKNCDAIQLPAIPDDDDDDDDDNDDNDDDDIDDLYCNSDYIDEDGINISAFVRSLESRNESERLMRALLNDVSKFVLSTSPSKSKANYGDDFVVAVIYAGAMNVAFWRPGQDKWVDFKNVMCCDVCFFRGEFYGINIFGQLFVWDLKKNIPWEVFIPLLPELVQVIDHDNMYIMGVESESEGLGSYLLVVMRYKCIVHGQDAADTTYETKSFKVFKVDVDMEEVQEINDLGNRAIFVGFNHTFSIKASTSTNDDHKHECKANCIYFTDDTFQLFQYNREGGGGDMGIYNLALNEFVHHRHPFYEGPSHLSKLNPPMWVQLS